jgi:hypothetical protein
MFAHSGGVILATNPPKNEPCVVIYGALAAVYSMRVFLSSRAKERRKARRKNLDEKKPGREKILPGFTDQC